MPACKHGAWDYCGQCLAEYALEQPVRVTQSPIEIVRESTSERRRDAMLSIYQCPVCGGRECTTSGDCARGCVSPIKTVVTVSDVWGDEVARLTRERDEARAELRDVEVALDHLVRQALGLNRLDTAGTALKCIDAVTDERNRLRALLREVEWVFIRGDAQMCPVCTGTRRYGRRVQEDEGHRIDCRLKAALEEESHD